MKMSGIKIVYLSMVSCRLNTRTSNHLYLDILLFFFSIHTKRTMDRKRTGCVLSARTHTCTNSITCTDTIRWDVCKEVQTARTSWEENKMVVAARNVYARERVKWEKKSSFVVMISVRVPNSDWLLIVYGYILLGGLLARCHNRRCIIYSNTCTRWSSTAIAEHEHTAQCLYDDGLHTNAMLGYYTLYR